MRYWAICVISEIRQISVLLKMPAFIKIKEEYFLTSSKKYKNLFDFQIKQRHE